MPSVAEDITDGACLSVKETYHGWFILVRYLDEIYNGRSIPSVKQNESQVVCTVVCYREVVCLERCIPDHP